MTVRNQLTEWLAFIVLSTKKPFTFSCENFSQEQVHHFMASCFSCNCLFHRHLENFKCMLKSLGLSMGIWHTAGEQSFFLCLCTTKSEVHWYSCRTSPSTYQTCPKCPSFSQIECYKPIKPSQLSPPPCNSQLLMRFQWDFNCEGNICKHTSWPVQIFRNALQHCAQL